MNLKPLQSLVILFTALCREATALPKDKSRSSQSLTSVKKETQGNRVSLKSITRNYFNESAALEGKLKARFAKIKGNHPIRQYPNYEDDGGIVYWPNYYMGRWLYLKAKYVQEFKDYKQEIFDFEADGISKFEKLRVKALDVIKDFVLDKKLTVELMGREKRASESILARHGHVTKWFADQIVKLWENYKEKYV